MEITKLKIRYTLALLLTLVALPFPSLLAEAPPPRSSDASTCKPEDPLFQAAFTTEDDLQNFKKLRDFLRDRETRLGQIKYQLEELQPYGDRLPRLRHAIVALESNLGQAGTSDSTVVSRSLPGEVYDNAAIDGIRLVLPGLPTGPQGNLVKVSVPDLQYFITQAKENYDAMEANEQLRRCWDTSLKVLSKDINDCAAAIDDALAPEYKQQEFRQWVSIIFAALIFTVMLGFFGLIAYRSDGNLSKILLSGSGLQFVTIFVLIIAVILFGILDILKGSELAAILAGISGYILGKGVNKVGDEKKQDEPAQEEQA